MNKNYLKDLSEEEREQLRVKAAQVREDKKQYALDNLKVEWADKSYWTELAGKHNSQLPAWYAAGSELKYVRKVFKKSGLDIKEYVADMGCKNLQELHLCNPKANAQAMVGWALEYIEEKSYAATTN